MSSKRSPLEHGKLVAAGLAERKRLARAVILGRQPADRLEFASAADIEAVFAKAGMPPAARKSEPPKNP